MVAPVGRAVHMLFCLYLQNCNNRGTCWQVQNDEFCRCYSGFTGSACESIIYTNTTTIAPTLTPAEMPAITTRSTTTTTSTPTTSTTTSTRTTSTTTSTPTTTTTTIRPATTSTSTRQSSYSTTPTTTPTALGTTQASPEIIRIVCGTQKTTDVIPTDEPTTITTTTRKPSIETSLVQETSQSTIMTVLFTVMSVANIILVMSLIYIRNKNRRKRSSTPPPIPPPIDIENMYEMVSEVNNNRDPLERAATYWARE